MVDIEEGAKAEAEVDVIPARAVGVFVEGNDEPVAGEAQPQEPQDLDAVSRAGAQGALLTLSYVGVEIEYPSAIREAEAELAVLRLQGKVSNWEYAMAQDMIELRKLAVIADAVAERVEQRRFQIQGGLGSSEDRSFKCALGSATLAAPSTSVEVFDRAQIPAGFMKIEPDAKRIGDILRAGGPIPGAMLVTKGKPTLRISWTE